MRRIDIPPPAWLALAVICFVAALVSWQSQRLERLRPSPAPSPPGATGATVPSAAPAPRPGAQAAAAGVGTGGSADTRAVATADPADPAASDAAAAPLPGGSTAASPAGPAVPGGGADAGRVVLRCVVRGQVTYRDPQTGCPGGGGERVTVFPTAGVQPSR